MEVISEKATEPDEVRYEPVADANWFNLVSCADCSDVIEPVSVESWSNLVSWAACSDVIEPVSLANWFNIVSCAYCSVSTEPVYVLNPGISPRTTCDEPVITPPIKSAVIFPSVIVKFTLLESVDAETISLLIPLSPL